MAAGKNSFVLYADLIHSVEILTDEQAGKLFKHILYYVNDMDPAESDVIVRIAFEPIRQQLKRDLKQWRDTKRARSKAGKAGMDKRWNRQKGEQFYVLHVFNEDKSEQFVKVGVTSSSVGQRYSSSGKNITLRMPYLYEVKFVFLIEEKEMCSVDIEQTIAEKFKPLAYTPLKKFSGHMECFNIKCLDSIIQYATEITKDNKTYQRLTNITVNGNGTVNDNVNVNVDVVSRENGEQKIYPIEECLMIALRDSRFVKSNKTNDYELHRFNEYLEQQGIYHTNPLDYKKYFAKLKGKYPAMLKREMTVEELREIAKKMDQHGITSSV